MRYASRLRLAALPGFVSTAGGEFARINVTMDRTLAVGITDGPRTLLNLVNPGTFGHGGAFGTGGFVDPKNALVTVFLTQMMGGPTKLAKDAFTQIAEAAVR
jgi:CubicO group peptidase (beta-lactamase class C family)